MSVLVAASCTKEARAQWSYNGVNIYNTNSGYVGIGNSTPGSLLYVAKNMGEPAITIHNLGGGGGATYSMTDDLSGADWKFKATTYGGFKIRDHASSMDVITIEKNSAANCIYIKAGGNVGIGTTMLNTPAKLTVYQTTGTNYCIYGLHQSTEGAAGYFHADDNDGTAAGVLGRADGGDSYGLAGHAFYAGTGVGAWSCFGNLIEAYDGDYPGGVLRFYINQSGALYADGGFYVFKKSRASGEEKIYRAFSSLQATENWIEDIGSSELRNGEVTVTIDPVFSQVVNLQTDYKIFLTPVSEEMVFLVVTHKGPGHFRVKGTTPDGRPASCSFDYRIVTKDHENRTARMEIVHIPDPVEVPRDELKVKKQRAESKD